MLDSTKLETNGSWNENLLHEAIFKKYISNKIIFL